MKDLILKHALINAIEHEGKAEEGAILGKVIAEDPSAKNKVKEIIEEIRKTVKEVNSLSVGEQKKRLEKMKVKIEKKGGKEEKYELPELPGAKTGKVVTAFPPEPSKFPHLGHAKAALINFLYAKKYKGKFILRFEDSNPGLVRKEYYDAIIDGLKWLEIKWNKLDFLTDHMEDYYKTVELLIKKDKAYVCLCKQEEIKHKRAAGERCKHRDQSKEENLKLWEKMKKEFKEGEATVRLKINMSHPNALMRDPSIVRIIDLPHARTKGKYRIWPMYDFGTAMLDIWEGVSHRIRSKEFELRKELQYYIQKILGYPNPFITEMGRFNIRGVPSSGRIIREMIDKKELLGWDDPRLTTLMALKRRGFTPEGIKNFLISTGITKTEAIIDWEPLEAENRKIVDSIANRYFAVLDPVAIDVKNAPKIKSVKAKLHPDFPKRGTRKIPVNSRKIYIEREDLEKLQGKEVGLISLFSVRLNEVSEFTDEKIKMELQKIQWISESNVKIKIIMPDGSKKDAIAEHDIKKVKEGEMVQLVRIGFCRIDKVNKDIVLYYAHK
jgi:glutamyl-tRNA synthetase